MGHHSPSEHEPTLFTVERVTDTTGISGTGRVLDGVIYHTGQVAICWRSDLREPAGHSSIAIYPSVQAFIDVHLAPHGLGASRVVILHGHSPELDEFSA